MGLFKKLKQGMGIGTISFDLEFPAQVPAASGVIEGTIVGLALTLFTLVLMPALYARFGHRAVAS